MAASQPILHNSTRKLWWLWCNGSTEACGAFSTGSIPVSHPKRNMTVTVYSTTTCPYCKMEKEYLDLKKIAYTNFFADEDSEKAQEMIDLSGQYGVPVTVVEKDGKKEIIVGFDKARLNKVIGIA